MVLKHTAKETIKENSKRRRKKQEFKSQSENNDNNKFKLLILKMTISPSLVMLKSLSHV